MKMKPFQISLFFILGVCASSVSFGTPTFIDITAESGITFRHYYGDLKLDNIVEGTGAGVCVLDFDGDGLRDLYFVTGKWTKGVSSNRGRSFKGKVKNQLYRNLGSMRFEDVTEEQKVGGENIYSTGCAAADFDNDGDTDLYLLNYGRNILYRNDGTHFTDVGYSSGLADPRWSVSAVFLDYDQDGDLDVYVGNYLHYDDGKFRDFYAAKGYPGPLSYQGQADALYENQGDGTFIDVTKKAGVYKPRGRAMSVSASDLNSDGLLDIYVANDAMENYYFEQTPDHKFKEKAVFRGLAFSEHGQGVSSMGPVIGDLDGNGKMDIFIPDLRYNTLLLQGENAFRDETRKAGISEIMGQYSGWGAVLFDFDHDGWLDIFTVHGHAHFEFVQEDTLLRNLGQGKFVDVSTKAGPYFSEKYVGRGAASADLDGDGDIDLVITNLNDSPRILRNDSKSRNHWIQIEPLLGISGNVRAAIGTRVTLTAGKLQLTKELIPTQGYLSQSDTRLHFGLGREKMISKIEVQWPDGEKSILKNIASDRFLEVRHAVEATFK